MVLPVFLLFGFIRMINFNITVNGVAIEESVILLRKWIAFLSLSVLIFCIVRPLVGLIRSLMYKNTYYIITDKGIASSGGLGSGNIKYISLKDVGNIQMYQSKFEKKHNIGTISFINTKSPQGMNKMESIPNTLKVFRVLMENAMKIPGYELRNHFSEVEQVIEKESRTLQEEYLIWRGKPNWLFYTLFTKTSLFFIVIILIWTKNLSLISSAVMKEIVAGSYSNILLLMMINLPIVVYIGHIIKQTIYCIHSEYKFTNKVITVKRGKKIVQTSMEKVNDLRIISNKLGGKHDIGTIYFVLSEYEDVDQKKGNIHLPEHTFVGIDNSQEVYKALKTVATGDGKEIYYPGGIRPYKDAMLD